MGAIKDISLGTSKTHRIAPESIEIQEGFNCRTDYGDIDVLARQIQEHGGLIQPLVGHMNGDKFRVTDGHRRTKAIQHILNNGGELPYIDVVLEPKGTTEAQRISKQITTCGKNLTPIEQSDVIVKLRDLKISTKDISKLTGLTTAYISQLIRINNLPQLGKDMVHAGIISSTLAMQLINQCKGNDELLNEKIQEINERFEETGEKVTLKQLKPISNESKNKNQNSSPNEYKDHPENQTQKIQDKSLKDTIHEAFEENSQPSSEPIDGLTLHDYKLFIQSMVALLDKINIEDETLQNKVINIIERAEAYTK